MKRIVVVLGSVLLIIIAVSGIFSESIGVLSAELIYKNTVSEYSVSDKSESVKLRKNDYIYFGKIKDENILWKVLSVNENGEPLLLSERIICFMPFNSDTELKAGSSDWSSSTVRKWLNSQENSTFTFKCISDNKIKDNTLIFEGGFLCCDNFSQAEISAIKNTADRVFLPTVKMLSGIPTAERKKSPTAEAVKNDNSRYLQLRKSCWYWTQNSITTNTSSVSAVTSSGSFYKSVSNDGLTGVCPVTVLKTDSIAVKGGNGSINTPYIFESEGYYE